MVTTVAGLEIVLPEGTPLAALVVLKYLDSEGDYVYAVSSTQGLSAVEAMGMTDLAKMRLRDLFYEDADD
jgi:hypothetical protein